MRIFRSTERQMKKDREKENGQARLRELSGVSRRSELIQKHRPKQNNNVTSSNFVQVVGLPLSIDESYVAALFPGK